MAMSNSRCLCRAVDPFLKKEWYDIKAPSMFTVRQVGKTLITRTQGTKVLTICCYNLGLATCACDVMTYNPHYRAFLASLQHACCTCCT